MNSGLRASGAVAVTPANDTNLDQYGVPVVLYIGVGGDVSVKTLQNEDSVIFKNVPSGTFLPVYVKQVNATGTTATDILAIR